jgi:hypothetical protein
MYWHVTTDSRYFPFKGNLPGRVAVNSWGDTRALSPVSTRYLIPRPVSGRFAGQMRLAFSLSRLIQKNAHFVRDILCWRSNFICILQLYICINLDIVNIVHLYSNYPIFIYSMCIKNILYIYEHVKRYINIRSARKESEHRIKRASPTSFILLTISMSIATCTVRNHKATYCLNCFGSR